MDIVAGQWWLKISFKDFVELKRRDTLLRDPWDLTSFSVCYVETTYFLFFFLRSSCTLAIHGEVLELTDERAEFPNSFLISSLHSFALRFCTISLFQSFFIAGYFFLIPQFVSLFFRFPFSQLTLVQHNGTILGRNDGCRIHGRPGITKIAVWRSDRAELKQRRLKIFARHDEQCLLCISSACLFPPTPVSYFPLISMYTSIMT